LAGALGLAFAKPEEQSTVAIKNEQAQQIPSRAAVVATYDYLTKLSGRPEIYSLHYVFRGTKQYSPEKYVLPENVEYAAIDFSDLMTYQIQYSQEDFYSGGYERVRDLLLNNFGLVKVTDTQSVWKKGYNSEIKLVDSAPTFDIANPQNINLGDEIAFLGYSSPQRTISGSVTLIDLSFFWKSLTTITADYQLQIAYLDRTGKILYQRYFPLAYGLYPSSQWPQNKIIKTNQWLQLPEEFQNKISQLKISLVELEGYLGLNNLKSAEIKITDKKNLGDPILIKL
jgi:hypothetical protein